MNTAASEQSVPRSVAETHIGGGFLLPQSTVPGRGCLLQIYPAAIHAEIMRLTKRRTIIGRDLSCDVALEDTSVSRMHAAIDADDSGYTILDLGSRNGTFVEDQLLKGSRRLTGGELIRTGSTILKFMASMDEEAQYHAVVHELMTRDPLTSAFNRSFLMSSLDRQLNRGRRTGLVFSVILIDLDHFKSVNDSHGHLVGDEVLRAFAERLRILLRPGDLLCRLGGEEFVVVAEQAALHESVRVAERLRLAISSNPFQTEAGVLGLTCSIGVASFTGPESTVDQILSEADRYLYLAKKAGRNCVRSSVDTETVTKSQ